MLGVESASYLQADAARPGEIVDQAGNPLAADATASWTADMTAPTAAFSTIGTPRNTAVDAVDVTFSEPVLGLTAASFTLFRNATTVPLAAAVLTGGGSSYRLAGLAGATALPGVYELRILSVTGGIGTATDAVGNPVAVATATWVVDTVGPAATLQDVSSPRTAALDAVAVTFDEPVTGLDASGFRLTRDGTNVPLSGLTVTGSGAAYTLAGLAAFTAIDGSYELSLPVAGSVVKDAAGNSLARATKSVWTLDGTGPRAVFEPVASPRSSPVATLTVTFTENVGGFDLADLRLTRDGFPVPLAGAAVIGEIGSAHV